MSLTRTSFAQNRITVLYLRLHCVLDEPPTTSRLPFDIQREGEQDYPQVLLMHAHTSMHVSASKTFHFSTHHSHSLQEQTLLVRYSGRLRTFRAVTLIGLYGPCSANGLPTPSAISQ